MDEKAWYRLLAHIASQADGEALLKGFITQQDGHLHFILTDANEQVDPARIKEILQQLLNDPTAAAHIQKLVGDAGEGDLATHLTAIIVSEPDVRTPAGQRGKNEPKTLRESIDGEWPW